MKIGIIGSGQIGSTLVRRFRATGHDVIVANSRGPGSLADLGRETGARTGWAEEVVRTSELVVLTIPLKNVASLPSGLFTNAPPGLIVVDTSNYYPRQRDGRIPDIEAGITESGWVQKQIGRHVVKAFNSILAQSLLENGKPAGTPGRIALAIAGDDTDEKSVVMKLIDEIGFDTVDAGTILESWRQQPGTPGYCRDFDIAGVRTALQEAHQARTSEWSGSQNSPGTFEAPR